MSLPINRSAKATLDANLVNGITSDAPALKASDDVVYNTIDELYNYALSLVTSGTLSPLPPTFMPSQIATNPNFDIWQMGTSFADPASLSYMADQWYAINTTTATFSEQTASPPVGSSSYARMTVTALGGFINFGQCFESDVCHKLKGQRVSLSILMRKDSTFDGQYRIIVEKNAAADTSGGTWTNIATSSASTLDTSWSLLTLENVLIPTDANGLRIHLAAFGGTRPVNSYVEFAQVQHNVGTTAQPFQPRSKSEELDLCERFLHKSYDPDVTPGIVTVTGEVRYAAAVAGGEGAPMVFYPRTMRIIPTLTLYSPITGASGQRRNYTTGLDEAVTGSVNARGFQSHGGASAAHTASSVYGYQYVADSRL